MWLSIVYDFGGCSIIDKGQSPRKKSVYLELCHQWVQGLFIYLFYFFIFSSHELIRHRSKGQVWTSWCLTQNHSSPCWVPSDELLTFSVPHSVFCTEEPRPKLFPNNGLFCGMPKVDRYYLHLETSREAQGLNSC